MNIMANIKNVAHNSSYLQEHHSEYIHVCAISPSPIVSRLTSSFVAAYGEDIESKVPKQAPLSQDIQQGFTFALFDNLSYLPKAFVQDLGFASLTHVHVHG